MEVYGAYSSNVELLRHAIHENKHQMGMVSEALGNFQTGLLGVEREMLPIYKLTEKLRESQKNIDLCVHELRKINQNFIVAQELAPTLLNGSKFDQDEYVRALQKLLDAIAFLESHRAYEGSAKALDQARDLLGQARKKCKADFLSAAGILSRGTRHEQTCLVQWSKPNKQDVAKAAQLLHCLINSHVDMGELLSEYGNQRFQVIKMLLVDETASTVATPTEFARRMTDIEITVTAEKLLSEIVFVKEELSHAAFRHAVHPLLQNLKTDVTALLESQITPPSSSSSSKAQPTDPFKLLLLHEQLVMRAKDLDGLLQPPLLLRDQKGKGLDDPWVLSKLLGSIVSELATATKQKLFGYQFEMTEHINISDRSMVKDGNVHPVSSHMLNFLRQLCEHTKPLRVLLAKDSNVTSCSFIETVVMQLVETLQARSAQFKGRGDLKHLFLANNFGYIRNSLPRCQTDEPEIEAHIQNEIKPRMDELRDTSINNFVHVSYQPFEAILAEPTEKLVYQKGGSLLTLESGRILKDKFSRFNALIEDINKTQRHFIVTEPNIRHQLIQAAIEAVVPRYTKFHEKYSVIHFSKKNTSKYVKYTPKAAEQLLKELFLGEVIVEDK
ncbi:TPA: hypothetical protein N0F65_000953 [Lagenidium giganteum]|uniref:Exocyst subunit Exo70 family protein n=1 Tax=Lagenidium giganteum TaxID=4803 RepID=A0AAV2YUU0_9STRA|nr:TPA: hypothetical protein N0F65_000953 [Lagenidium giganteum]